jgi:hypothetical protein
MLDSNSCDYTCTFVNNILIARVSIVGCVFNRPMTLQRRPQTGRCKIFTVAANSYAQMMVEG